MIFFCGILVSKNVKSNLSSAPSSDEGAVSTHTETDREDYPEELGGIPTWQR